MASNLAEMNPLVFPGMSKIRRDHAVKPQYRGPNFDDNYDFHTLAYDAFYCDRKSEIILVCPKLLNFAPVVKNGVFTSNIGKHKIISIRNHRRHSQIRLEAKSPPSALKFTFCGIAIAIPLSDQENQTFRNLNCLVAISRNNRLEWIRDWATHHVRWHNANGLVLFDNASTDYSLTDIAGTLSQVPGLQKFRIVSAPFKFGPTGIGRHWSRSTFLQPAMLNLAHLRFLANAAAVLSVDIDELTCSRDGSSIFDAARASALGCVTFRGVWRYPGMDTNKPLTHQDHIYQRNEDRTCSGKYCISPGGVLGEQPREIHGIGNGLFDRIAQTSRFSFMHCYGISTGWKYKRNELPEFTNLIEDPYTANLFKSV